MIAARALVVLAALLAIAWLGVSYGNTRAIRHAQVAAANRHASPAEIESALRDVRSAHTLDPSRTESLSYVAALEIRAGRLDEAAKVYEEIVRREPDTVEAWFLIAELDMKSNPARAAAARAQLHRLDPLGAGQP